MPFATQGLVGSAYLPVGQVQEYVEWCRAQLARGGDTHSFSRASLVLALTITGSFDEATTAAAGLIDAAEATNNPFALLYALFACGMAFREADTDRARDALQRGLVIAQDSGNRAYESHLAVTTARLEGEFGDPLDALGICQTGGPYATHDSGNTSMMGTRIGGARHAFSTGSTRHGPAAIIAGFAFNPFTEAVIPEFNTAIGRATRCPLESQTYQSLARKGRAMTDCSRW